MALQAVPAIRSRFAAPAAAQADVVSPTGSPRLELRRPSCRRTVIDAAKIPLRPAFHTQDAINAVLTNGPDPL